MKDTSRRFALLAGVSVAAIAGLGVISSRSDLFVPTDSENTIKPIVSFRNARGMVDKLVLSELEMAQKELGMKYTKDEIEDIRARIWDHTQVALLRSYRSEEKPEGQ
jgi:hypothetical protein